LPAPPRQSQHVPEILFESDQSKAAFGISRIELIVSDLAKAYALTSRQGLASDIAPNRFELCGNAPKGLRPTLKDRSYDVA